MGNAGGATGVVVKNACGKANTIDVEQLDERAQIYRFPGIRQSVRANNSLKEKLI